MAHAGGADFLEQDIVATRDGVALVFHDLFLDALTDVAERFPGRARSDGFHYCVDFDHTEIQTLTLRERRVPDSGEPLYPARFPPHAAGFRIPTLAEELAFVRGLNQSTGREAGVYPEIKEPAWHRREGIDLSAAVLADLDAAGYLAAGQKIFLQCFDADELQRLRGQVGTGLPMIQLLSSKQSGFDLRAISRYAQGIGPSLKLLVNFAEPGHPGTGLREAAAEAGLLVHPYTLRADDLPPGVASLDELLELVVGRLQVNGVFTDFPDRARTWLDRETD